MRDEALRPRVFDVIASHLRLDPLGLVPTQSLHDDLGLDSLGRIDLVCALESTFDVALSESDVETLITCDDVVRQVRAALAQRKPGGGVEPTATLWVRVHQPHSGAVLERAVELSPYMVQTVAEDVRSAGPNAYVEVVVPEHEPDEMVASIEQRFARVRRRGATVNVSRGSRLPPPAGRLRTLVELATRIGTLLHEIQLERGLTCLHLSVRHRDLPVALEAKHQATDRALAEYAAYFAEHQPLLPEPVDEHAARALGALGQLDGIRRLVLEPVEERGMIIHRYAELDAELMAVTATIASVAPDAEYGRMAESYLALVNARESSALGSAVGSGGMTPGQDVALASLMSAQRSFMAIFASTARPEVMSAYRRKAADPSFREVDRLAQLMLTGPGTVEIDANAWYRATATKLDRLREVEQVQLAALMRRASAVGL
jgi:acyl carrier protein